MAENTIEIVAQAIYESHHGDEWQGGDGIEAELFRQDARAAIEAMREPTEAMKQAGAGTALSTDEDIGLASALRCWDRMLTAALNESTDHVR